MILTAQWLEGFIMKNDLVVEQVVAGIRKMPLKVIHKIHGKPANEGAASRA